MIETRSVRVDYDDVTAVHDLDLEIGRGEVFGLIGPNGAGKTSTIRVLATLQKPTYGEVRIAGFDADLQTADVHRVLGYMPDLAPVYDNLRCWEFLDLFAGAYFVDRRDRRRRIEECIDLVNLPMKRNAMAGTLSRGMTQRLVLAKTLLHDPQVLLLDEPASGLDPIARIELRDLLRRLAGEGKTVLISSHILTELSEFCSSVGIMEKGHLVECGSIDDIVSRLGSERRLDVALVDVEHIDAAVAWLREQTGVESVAALGTKIEVIFLGDDASAALLLAGLLHQGAPVYAFAPRKVGVEDIVLKVGARQVS